MTPRACRPHLSQEHGEGGSLGGRVIVEQNAEVTPGQPFPQPRKAHEHGARDGNEPGHPRASCSQQPGGAESGAPAASNLDARRAAGAGDLERFAQAFEHHPRLKDESERPLTRQPGLSRGSGPAASPGADDFTHRML